jgi:hypothetical protein
MSRRELSRARKNKPGGQAATEASGRTQVLGAGDENRTRTVSLGIARICPVLAADLRVRSPASDRDCPLFTGANGPLMARGQLCPDLLGQNRPGSCLDLKSLASRLSVDGVL